MVEKFLNAFSESEQLDGKNLGKNDRRVRRISGDNIGELSDYGTWRKDRCYERGKTD